ncbi:hypothetical protein [Bacillus massilinigeriensis]|uniref:hypothetical protein n=1 Tax=Bacillus mediterraneensis TaxID=1805474 RepID=UPI0008F818DB|nr:hypothetical protein [Bacillus mediterraneensis]
MRKAHVFLLLSLILATILGIFGQDIAYFINGNIREINPISYLTGITMASILLYLIAALLTFIFTKKQMIRKGNMGVYLLAICLIGAPTSLWSLFVLIMWRG